MAAPNHSTRPFWAGLNPDHPEPLDKVLAALHCYQVAQPDGTGLYFEFTVKHSDHYRIYDGFPELRKLAAALEKDILFDFDPSTGKLATMTPDAYNRVRVTVIFDIIRIMSTGLDAIGRLPSPIGPSALKVALGANKDIGEVAAFPAGMKKPPSFILAVTDGSHESASKQAQYITKHPGDTRTVVSLQLALPRQVDSSRGVQRLAEHSSVSVFTMINGAVKTVVHREPLCTPGGEIKLWLSDLVKPEEIGGSSDFTRPLDSGANHPTGCSIAIPYTAIVNSLLKAYDFPTADHSSTGINAAKAAAPGSTTLDCSSRRYWSNRSRRQDPKQPIGSGKRSMSTLASGNAGGNSIVGTFASPMPHVGNRFPSMAWASRYGSAHRRTEGVAAAAAAAALFHPHPPVVAPIQAMVAPWRHLLARLPRKW